MNYDGGVSWGMPLGLATTFLGKFAELEYWVNNRCISATGPGLTNLDQLKWIDWYNATKQRPLYASEACCACGGGTTKWQGPDLEVVTGLNQLFNDTGAQWGNSQGWGTDSHYCTW